MYYTTISFLFFKFAAYYYSWSSEALEIKGQVKQTENAIEIIVELQIQYLNRSRPRICPGCQDYKQQRMDGCRPV
jgi:hypothetical protein